MTKQCRSSPSSHSVCQFVTRHILYASYYKNGGLRRLVKVTKQFRGFTCACITMFYGIKDAGCGQEIIHRLAIKAIVLVLISVEGKLIFKFYYLVRRQIAAHNAQFVYTFSNIHLFFGIILWKY